MEQLSIETQLSEFDKFIQIPENDRIIFSGPFGTGKTYFLNKYFKENYETFIPLFLSPVDYSISSSEDIFELIKYDVICEILKNHPNLDRLDLSFLETIATLSENNIRGISVDMVKLIIEHVPKIGKELSSILDGILALNKVINDKKKLLNINDGIELQEYGTTQETKIGSIREHNFITELIGRLIREIRNRENKKVVLIVDDLDRIDPEHIFRILNIFSVHFNEVNNKFLIDKIVLCCDIENIRTIYSHKYRF